MAKKRRKIGVVGAWIEGLKLAAATAPFALPVVVAYGLISGLVGYYAVRVYEVVKGMSPDDLALYSQVTGVVGALLFGYMLLQFIKRKTASRVSWIPGLFAVPVTLIWVTMYVVRLGADRGLELLFFNVPWQAWTLIWQSFGGAALAVVSIRLAQRHLEGEDLDAGSAYAEMGRRTLEVAAPMGAKVHAVIIGMQLLIPGIFYALQLAFVPHVAVLEGPDSFALKRSGALSWGTRGRIFRILFVWLVASFALQMGVLVLLQGQAEMMQSLMDMTVLSLPSVLVQDLIWATTSWVCTLTLLVVYRERLAREARIQARKAKKKAEKSEPEAAEDEG